MITVGKGKFKIKRPKGKKKTLDGGSSSSASPPPPPPPPWIELPSDVTANILHRLGAIDILENAQKVCTTWRTVCQDPAMWRVIDMWNLGDFHNMPYSPEVMCRHAVDRSQGQLININIEYFGTDDLLMYIAQRCNHLKRLRIALCYEISGEGLSEAVTHFPELEELHLFFMTSVEHDDIETIGYSCPNLKSLTYNNRGYKYPIPGEEGNDYALAISRSMPNLQHLRLFGDNLKNEGLKALLDSCPRLESLDLRQCFSVDLGGDLGKRCSQQIKDLRLPYDSTDDYEWDSAIYEGNPWFSSDLSDGFSFEDYDDYMDPFGLDFYSDVEDFEFSPHEEFL